MINNERFSSQGGIYKYFTGEDNLARYNEENIKSLYPEHLSWTEMIGSQSIMPMSDNTEITTDLGD